MLLVSEIDFKLSGVHEKWLMKEAGKRQYTVEEAKQIEEVEAVYQEFKKQCLQFSDADSKKDSAKLAKLVQSVRAQVDFQAAVFK